jgi:hypothetical protein
MHGLGLLFTRFSPSFAAPERRCSVTNARVEPANYIVSASEAWRLSRKVYEHFLGNVLGASIAARQSECCGVNEIDVVTHKVVECLL